MMSSRWRWLNAIFKAPLSRGAQPACAAVEALESRRLLTAWYVSTTGASSNPGTLNEPLATIQEAANVAQPGDTVYIMGGVYHETVTPARSGTAAKPITFEPYDGQSVTIDGADPITDWSLYQGSIYSAPQSWDLGEGNNQVFVDGTMVNEARWPNTPADIPATNTTSDAPANISTPNWATASSVSVTQSTTGPSTVTIYNSSLNQPAGTWVGSVAHIEAGQQWVDQTGTITASSPGSITVSYEQETTDQVPQAGNPFYIVGSFKALDAPGQWYLDPATGNLYLWDPAGDNPADHTIEAKAREYGFDLSGLSYVNVSDINLFACTINTSATSSHDVLNGISAQYVSQSIGITPDTQDPWGAQYHPHTTGIILNGTDNILDNSTIAFSSGDGVFLGGSGNTVENTVIHDVDYEAGDEAGVTSLGSDETIINNTIFNAGRSGIVCRYTYGSLISHNIVHTVGLQTTDLGGIYTYGTNGEGTEISFNVVYDIHAGGYGAAGIYLDNFSQDFVVDHNVVFDCDFALKLNPPSNDNEIVDNTFVGTQYGLESSGNEDMTGTVLANNIFVGPTMVGPGATQTNNITSPTNPEFVDPAENNYQLQAGSPAINAGIPELPYTADSTGPAPDCGAYEHGLAPFEAGAPAQPFISPTPTKATPTITWADPSPLIYGTALGPAQLDATSMVPGTFVYTPAAGTILDTGNGQSLSVTFTPTNTGEYASATASVTINVARSTPAITWTNPSPITYGTALGPAQLDAKSTIPGTFVYTPAAGTVPGAASGQNLSVTFTPADTVDYSDETASATINVVKATPGVTWQNPAAITYGTALSAAQLDATSNVPGTFVYIPEAGTILSAGSARSLSVSFTPTDTVDYASVTSSVPINVTPAAPAITWANPSPLIYGTAIGAAQLDAISNVPGTFVYSRAAGTILGAGGQNLSVTFTPANTVDYTAATSSVTVNVSQATPTINWAKPSPIIEGAALGPAQLDATSTIPGTFVYSPAAGTILGAGSGQNLSVTFTPTDAVDYTSATSSVTINVTPATPTITWPNPSPLIYGTALGAAQLDATSTVPGTFVYSPTAGTVLGAGNSQNLSVTFTPTNNVDYTGATSSVAINISQAMPTITWPNPSPLIYGTALGAAQLDATSNVPGTFVYSPAAGTVLGAGNGQNLSVTFTPTDDIDYTGATSSVTINVSQATPTITWANPSPLIYGTALGAAQLDATSTIPGTFVYSPAAGTILSAGNGQDLSVTFTPTDTADYTSASASATINILQATPTISWANPAAVTSGTRLSAAQLDATSTIPGTFVYTPAAGTILAAGSSQNLSVTFTPTDTVDFTSAAAMVKLTVNSPPVATAAPQPTGGQTNSSGTNSSASQSATTAPQSAALSETVTTTLPSALISGMSATGAVTLSITNNGKTAFRGLTPIDITASTVAGVTGTSIAALSKNLTILPGKMIKVSVPVRSLPALADNHYFLVAQVTDPRAGGVTVGSSANTLTITAPQVALAAMLGPAIKITTGDTLTLTDNGNVDDLTSFHITFGFSLDAAGLRPIGQSGSITTGAMHLKAGKSLKLHLTAWKSLDSGLTPGVSYYLTASITDTTGNSAFAVSTKSFTVESLR